MLDHLDLRSLKALLMPLARLARYSFNFWIHICEPNYSSGGIMNISNIFSTAKIRHGKFDKFYLLHFLPAAAILSSMGASRMSFPGSVKNFFSVP
jgi:hypothetical protein